MHFLKILCTLFFVNVFCLPSISSASIFPRGCEVTGYGFVQNYLLLNETGTQTLYLMQNHSSTIIELEHYENHPDVFMSPQLESKISPTHWAAFASDTEKMQFRCYKLEGDQYERIVINCQDVLDICQYPRVKFALSNMGTYWVSTDKTQAQVIADATKKGIYLRW